MKPSSRRIRIKSQLTKKWEIAKCIVLYVVLFVDRINNCDVTGAEPSTEDKI